MKGLITLITGGSRGLGKAIAIEYANQGATVIVTSRPDSPSGLPGTALETAHIINLSGGNALGIPCDITDEFQVNNVVKEVITQFGKIDVLVNNAGLMIPCEPFLDIDPVRWDQLMTVNIRGPYLACRAVVPVMMKQTRGTIINIGSDAGKAHRWGGTAYCTSKAALHMFSMCLAEELKESNISVNVLSPGGLKTSGSSIIPWAQGNWDDRVDPEDCGPAMVALALNTDSKFTGQILSRVEFGKSWR